MGLLKHGKFNIAADDMKEWLEDGFVEISRLDLSKKRHIRMLKEATELMKQNKDNISVKGCYALFSGDCFHDGKLRVKGHEVSCNAFSLVNEKNVKKVLFTMMTAGTWNIGEKSKDQLYMDMWGTAAIDAARIWLEQKIHRRFEKDYHVSPAYGPGYYGMDITASEIFGRILGSDQIGITVLNSGIMSPEKSLAAVYLITETEEGFPYAGCDQCIGSTANCQFCQINKLV